MFGGIVQNHHKKAWLVISALLAALVMPTVTGQSATARTLTKSEIVALAKATIRTNASSWGLMPTQLSVKRIVETTDGLATVRFDQKIAGVPVLNSLVAITLRNDGVYLSHTVNVSADSKIGSRKLSKARATRAARDYFLASAKLSAKSVRAVGTHIAYADPKLTDLVSNHSQLVWLTQLQVPSNLLASKVTFISDATSKLLTTKSVAHSFSNYPSPYVCDLQKVKPSPHFAQDISSKRINRQVINYIGATNGYPLCTKSDVGRITAPNSASIRGIKETVDYLRNQVGVDIASETYLGNISPAANFGRNVSAKTFCDRYPKSGPCVAVISGFTNVCEYNSDTHGVDCPLNNAFWVPWMSSDCHSGVCSAIFFGKGYEKVDDVVAHELAHGITGEDAFPTGLCNSCDADSISEALSDFIGEAVDELNVAPNEKPDVTWGMGEGVKDGPFRNMQMVGNATPCGSSSSWVPVRQIDASWDSTCDSHTNLGPADKFAWLISNGGSQNGINVTPIGTAPWDANHNYQLCNPSGSNCTAIVNMTRLAFQSLTKLNGNINYSDFGAALQQSCQDLTKAKQNPFPTSYCDQVNNALAATGIIPLQISGVTRVRSYTGSPVAVTATFGTTDGLPGVGVAMRIQFKRTGSRNWQTLSTATTNASGNATFSVTFPDAGTYLVSTVPSENVGNFTSLSYAIS